MHLPGLSESTMHRDKGDVVMTTKLTIGLAIGIVLLVTTVQAQLIEKTALTLDGAIQKK